MVLVGRGGGSGRLRLTLLDRGGLGMVLACCESSGEYPTGGVQHGGPIAFQVLIVRNACVRATVTRARRAAVFLGRAADSAVCPGAAAQDAARSLKSNVCPRSREIRASNWGRLAAVGARQLQGRRSTIGTSKDKAECGTPEKQTHSLWANMFSQAAKVRRSCVAFSA